MAERKIDINVGVDGMNRSGFNHQTDGRAYTFQLNGNIETDEQGGIALTNSHSNLLCNRFKPGYRVVGNKINGHTNKVYFFLTNPSTGVSEIGYIPFYHDIQDMEDTIIKDCDCNYETILSTPLENQDQIPGCEYTTVISDCEENKCLGFSVLDPIHDIEFKIEKNFEYLFWTSGGKFRYLDLSNIDQYFNSGVESCGEIKCGDGRVVQDISECETCLDCDKLEVFRKYQNPRVSVDSISFGGNLRRGTYEFLIAGSDRLGQELTSYKSITNPVPVFDTNNYRLTQPQLADRTNYAISLKIDNIDPRFEYYKIAVIQVADINEATSIFTVGVFPSSQTSVTYTTEQGKERIGSLAELFIKQPHYKNIDNISAINGHMFAYGFEEEPEWNLQPIANLMGGFLQWQTYQAKQGLYKDGANASKYRQYMRDEVYPFSFKIGTKTGFESRLIPLVPRPPREDEKEEIVINSGGKYVTSDINAQSILKQSPSCASTGRTKKWQYYNTARFKGYCTSFDTEDYETVIRTTYEMCKVTTDHDGTTTDVIKTIPAGTLQLPINTSDFKGLKQWFKDNKALIYKCCTGQQPCGGDIQDQCPTNNCQGAGQSYPPELCDLATNTYDEYSCIPSLPFDTCTDCDEQGLQPNECLPPVIAECSEEIPYPKDVFIKQVINEQFNLIPKEWATEYEPTQPFGNCDIYIDGEGEGFANGRLYDFFFSYQTDDITNAVSFVLQRMSESMYNKSCDRAYDVYEKDQTNLTFFLGYKFQERCIQDNFETLLTDVPSEPHVIEDESPFKKLEFANRISEESLWFKLEKNELENENQEEEPSVIFEITKLTNTESNYPKGKVPNFFEDLVDNQYYRVTVLSDCNTYIYSEIIHREDGYLKQFKLSDFNTNNTNTLYIVIDSPIISIQETATPSGFIHPFLCEQVLTTKYSAIAPPTGCFNVLKRYTEYKCAEVTHDGIEVSKRETYQVTCKYKVPHLTDCDPVPYAYGDFAYWESTEEYPDNSELYDSSVLNISPEDIPDSIKTEFEEYYVDGYTQSGNYHLKKEQTDLRCKPIRHYKFPDNSTENASFIYDIPTGETTDTIIYPLGFTIKEEVIHAFLDIAVKNKLLTQEQRDSISYIEFYRGSRLTHKSILYKGIAHDMYKYTERGQERWFRNFPFNSLGENQLLYQDNFRRNFIPHPYDSEGNTKFSVIAPEVYLQQPTGATEIAFEGYQMGYADGVFREVLEHSKWVVLGERAEDLASTLASSQVLFEIAIDIGEGVIGAAQASFAGIGSTNWGQAIAWTTVGILRGLNAVNSIIFNYARYRYEWIEIFKNNGTPYNFAQRFVGVGNYNFLQKNTNQDSLLRGIDIDRYLRPGNAIINTERGKKTIRVNNIDRETSHFVSTGEEYPVEYPYSYINWDNTDQNINSSSRYLMSQAFCSDDISVRRVGSPYVSLKTYNPTQYGTINSIEWVPIHHEYKLDKQNQSNNDCVGIFGGDTYITQVAFKTKYRFFLVDAMELPDRTPFDYFLYSNIGSSRFYASYETPVTRVSYGSSLPSRTTTFNFNCPSEDVERVDSFYLKPEVNKKHHFLLHSYGIANFFVESTINNEYRYAMLEPHEQFYPNVDEVEWTEESKNSIFHDNLFFYNNAYSKDTTNDGETVLPSFYNKKEWEKSSKYPNGVIWSLQDNSETDIRRDPWLIYPPYNRYLFKTSYGKLYDLHALESSQALARFENNAAVFNAIDVLAERMGETESLLGTGGIFVKRPVEFSHTELGETGTQSKDIISTEYGHFWVDAKRGAVFQMMPNASGTVVVSAHKRDGRPSGMRQWFKRHLPFKILAQNIPGLESTSKIMDNKFNSLGINMWWDSKFKRLFITKRDKIVNQDCVKYSDEIGFYIDETECRGAEPRKECPEGYKYNEHTGLCEQAYTQTACPDGYTYFAERDICVRKETMEPDSELRCEEGWNYNPDTGVCERELIAPPCPDGCTSRNVICECIDVKEPIINNVKTPIDVSSFKDVSWTISYSPVYDSWISFHSFTPDYAVSYHDYFQTGINSEGEEKGLWSHLLTNKSFQVYYGKKYPWTIEVPFQNEYVSKILEAVNLSVDTYRYHGEYDFAHVRKKSFNKAVVYNNQVNSGEMHLEYHDSVVDHLYPKQINKYSQAIKAVHHKDTIRFNYFFDRSIREESMLPKWHWDKNEIEKTLNPLALTYTAKNPLERIRGQSFLLRLTQDKSSQYKQVYKWSFGKTHIDRL